MSEYRPGNRVNSCTHKEAFRGECARHEAVIVSPHCYKCTFYGSFLLPGTDIYARVGCGNIIEKISDVACQATFLPIYCIIMNPVEQYDEILYRRRLI